MAGSNSAPIAVDVAISWGGRLLAVERLCPPRCYVIGEPDDAGNEPDFAVNLPISDPATHALIRTDGDTVRVCPLEGLPEVLSSGPRDVYVGDLCFRVSVGNVQAVAAGPRGPSLDRRSVGWLGASMAVHAVFFLCMAWMPPKASSLSLDREQMDELGARYLLAPKEPTFEDPPQEAKASEDPQGGSLASGTGEPGLAGSPDAPRVKRRAGPATHSNEPLAEQAQKAGILGILGRHSGALDGSSPYLAGASVDEATLAGLFGTEIGSTFGFGGLTMRGTGRSGEGNADGTIGVSGLDTKAGAGVPHATLFGLSRKPRSPTVIHEKGASIKGSLSKEVIRREIQRHMNEVRFCYEQALQQSPALSGRVIVRFLIAPGGAVQAARVESSSLDSPRVSDCVASAVRRWTFPRPDDDGYVTVSYPFLFQAAL